MKNDNKEIKSPLLREIAKYVKYILGVMGFIKDEDYEYLSNEDTEAQVSEAVNVVVNLRQALKKSLAAGIIKEELIQIFDKASEEFKHGGFFEESKS